MHHRSWPSAQRPAAALCRTPGHAQGLASHSPSTPLVPSAPAGPVAPACLPSRRGTSVNHSLAPPAGRGDSGLLRPPGQPPTTSHPPTSSSSGPCIAPGLQGVLRSAAATTLGAGSRRAARAHSPAAGGRKHALPPRALRPSALTGSANSAGRPARAHHACGRGADCQGQESGSGRGRQGPEVHCRRQRPPQARQRAAARAWAAGAASGAIPEPSLPTSLTARGASRKAGLMEPRCRQQRHGGDGGGDGGGQHTGRGEGA